QQQQQQQQQRIHSPLAFAGAGPAGTFPRRREKGKQFPSSFNKKAALLPARLFITHVHQARLQPS
ncbi:hypothetical protein, partial [uncultured Stenotrophomonas sp.]|uniref:hypothetical protein n=1 Tax=uncultured Stenotrophomonas sp. TaxID=165438 RepID=UPI0025F9D405